MSDQLEQIGPLVERELATAELRYVARSLGVAVVELDRLHQQTGVTLLQARSALERLRAIEAEAA